MLRRGQRFTIGAQRWRVAYVNACRAHCVSESTRVVTVLDQRTGADRTFTATSAATLDISPDSQVDLLEEVFHA